MPSWKKVLVSGSSAHLNQITASGNATFGGDVNVAQYIKHTGDTNTLINFTTDNITLEAGGVTAINVGAPDVGFYGHVGMLDDKAVRFGGSNDLQIYHASGHNYMYNVGASSLIFQTNNGSTVLTLDDSQNATFAANVSSSATSTGSFGTIQVGGKDIYGDSDGIGIGTANPDSVLHVVGTAKFDSTIVQKVSDNSYDIVRRLEQPEGYKVYEGWKDSLNAY